MFNSDLDWLLKPLTLFDLPWVLLNRQGRDCRRIYNVGRIGGWFFDRWLPNRLWLNIIRMLWHCWSFHRSLKKAANNKKTWPQVKTIGAELLLLHINKRFEGACAVYLDLFFLKRKSNRGAKRKVVKEKKSREIVWERKKTHSHLLILDDDALDRRRRGSK